ncbi:helix-turn-helix transcriptional regulator [Pararobbsia silviterrae]|uniref:AlpA family phage regulatory protein n=1 Tax=Pararobbsia silviterrae TaxID=1792498 RepID=A0A494XAI7_9BURK|nr:AlpA family phage regulatory protein [Pararobbsia silviterrae]RKP46661.1 AlpA family phage regulatory protein [Pararobbsia silviterrae]
MKPIYLDLYSVAATVALSVATVQKLVREDSFPRPRMLSNHRVGWLTREIEDWAENRPISDIAPPPNTSAKKPRPSKRVSPGEPTAS